MFLDAYAETGNVKDAAKTAKISRRMHYKRLKTDPAYAKAFEETEQLATGTLEDEATRRAVEGVLEPVYYQGKKVGSVRRYADGLMMFLLRARNPEKYRERVQQELSGSLEIHQHKIVELLQEGRRRLAEMRQQEDSEQTS